MTEVITQVIEVDVIPDSPLSLVIVPGESLTIETTTPILTVEINPIGGLISTYEINEKFQLLIVDANGQTDFTLNSAPSTPENAKLFLNGQKMIYNQDYNILGGSLFWTSNQVLEITDELELYFY